MRQSPETLPIHPHTGLRAIYVHPRTGRAYWPVLGGSEPPPPPPPTGDPAPPPAPPAYTPPKDQAEHNRIIEDRLAQQKRQYGGLTPEQVQEKIARADAMDALELEMSSDMDKAARLAADQAYSAAMAESVPRIVMAEFRAAAKGVLTDDQFKALTDPPVDLTWYATDDGHADIEKITAQIAKIAPAAGQLVPPGAGPYRTLGQGAQPPAIVTPGEAGRAEAQRRFGNKAATPA